VTGDEGCEKPLPVRWREGAVAILAAIDEQNLEKSVSAIRRAAALQALQDIQFESVANGTDRMTMEEIDAVIAEVRRERLEHQG
jgi:hypothetical protein